MSLNTYGFVDDIYMKSKSFDVSVSAKDKIIQVMDGNVLLASLSMALNNNILSLIGKNDMVVAEVELPQSEVISNAYYDSENKQIVIVVTMADGSTSELTIDVSDLIMIYEGCNGIEVDGNKIGIKISEDSSKYLSADETGLSINMDSLDDTFATDEEVKESLKKFATLEDLALKADKTEIADMATKTWVNEQGFLTEHQDISNLVTKDEFNELEEKVSNKVDWTDISTEDNADRKAIILKNHDTILGTTTSGGTVNVAMVSKWDVVDLGTTTLPINLNTPKGVRPTVQEAGQTGEEANKIAYLSDVSALEETINNIEINIGETLKDYAKKDHNHDDVYSKLGHTHDEYVTEDELNVDLSNKVDWVNISTEENLDRKAIVLKNHDTLLGTDTKGQTYNIGMISKWDKVDLGTTSLPINLNGSAEHPTYNDEKEIAFVDDINNVEININETLKDYAKKDHNHDDVYSKLDHNHDDVYSKLGHNHDDVYSKLGHNHDDVYSKLDHNHDDLYSSINHNHDDVYSKLDHNHDDVYSKLGHTHDEYVTKDELITDLSNKVDWVNISTEENPDRKAIILKNHDTILGTTTSGGTVNVAMVSKWDVVDLGTTTLPINLNTPKGVRPTVQEAGQTGEEANKIAYLSDIDDAKVDINETLKNYVTIEVHEGDLDKKQDKLTPGNNITIEDNVISCSIDTKLFVILQDGNLPDVGDNNKIYLLPNNQSALNNQFTEYYYDNGRWEILGEFKPEVDLSAYVTNKKWETEIPPCVDNKFKDYTTTSQVRTICQEEIGGLIETAISTANEYTDNEIVKVKNDILNQVKSDNETQNSVITDNTNRITSLENRCDHYDKLFGALLEEHGDGSLMLNVYTKEEADKRFALKEDLANKVDWVQIGDDSNVNAVATNKLIYSNDIETIQNQINELKEKLIKLENQLSNLIK